MTSGRRLAALSAFVLVGLLAGSALAGCSTPGSNRTSSTPPPACRPVSRPAFALPSLKGLNYGTPYTVSGDYVGVEWLRTGQGDNSPFEQTYPALQADLAFIKQHNLGRVMRLFLGIDQTMVWNDQDGFVRFDDKALDNFQRALDLFDAQGMKVIVVLFDEEEQDSIGTFRYAALDGHHPNMRSNYLRAIDIFLKRFGASSTVTGWDLFNEAYNSLGQDGGNPKPGYSSETVHTWLHDLYVTAKCAAPNAWFTNSDATELYGKAHPDVLKLEDSVDYYDIHVYDDHPQLPDWRSLLHKPYIIGEAGANDQNNHYRDQRINPDVVSYLLGHAQQAGVKAVLAHSADDNVYPRDRSGLTPTGQVISAF
jgi:Cellulase (glycosyl hydrolase family 5)